LILRILGDGSGHIVSVTIETAWTILHDLAIPPYLLLDVNRILDIFGLFFIIIIGIELLGTIEMIIEESIMNVDVIILVGITAIVRKILIID
jgi:uncharacterized membrane protein (DUF373 family)